MDSDFVVGIDKSIDAAKGITGREYPSYLHNTVVTEKLDELAEAISEGSGGASALSDLTDVDISGSVQGGKVLKYNAVEEKWAPGDDSGNVQSDWNESDPTSGAYILNKPSIPNAPVELTQAEYDALTPAEKMSDTPYLITDANGDGSQFQPVIFSTTEREIGVWTDGKPLYERTINCGTLPDGTSSSPATLVVENIPYISELIDLSGYAISNTSPGYCYPLPFSASPATSNIRVDFRNYDLRITTYDFWSSYDAYLTIRYTKNTDAPGSGVWTPQGIPAVHYSTDERIVGTWIDGKTLYEKTVSENIVTDSAQVIATIVGAKYKGIEGFIATPTGGIVPVPFNDGSSCYVPYTDEDDVKLAKNKASLGEGNIIVLTMRYTKTTD